MKKLALIVVCISLFLAAAFMADAEACSYYDSSDAPGYGTAWHKIRSSSTSWQWFGSGVDSEWSRGHDPEDDGFSFSCFRPGECASLTYTAHSRRPAGRTEYIGVWVDWNQDNYFSNSERLINATWQVNAAKTITETVNFIVPTNALLGTTWLRARIACSSISNAYCYKNQGEVEDHQIESCDEVPEPGTIALISSLAIGLFGTAGIKKKGRK
jgi:hypothetical protein